MWWDEVFEWLPLTAIPGVAAAVGADPTRVRRRKAGAVLARLARMLALPRDARHAYGRELTHVRRNESIFGYTWENAVRRRPIEGSIMGDIITRLTVTGKGITKIHFQVWRDGVPSFRHTHRYRPGQGVRYHQVPLPTSLDPLDIRLDDFVIDSDGDEATMIVQRIFLPFP